MYQSIPAQNWSLWGPPYSSKGKRSYWCCADAVKFCTTGGSLGWLGSTWARGLWRPHEVFNRQRKKGEVGNVWSLCYVRGTGLDACLRVQAFTTCLWQSIPSQLSTTVGPVNTIYISGRGRSESEILLPRNPYLPSKRGRRLNFGLQATPTQTPKLKAYGEGPCMPLPRDVRILAPHIVNMLSSVVKGLCWCD